MRTSRRTTHQAPALLAGTVVVLALGLGACSSEDSGSGSDAGGVSADVSRPAEDGSARDGEAASEDSGGGSSAAAPARVAIQERAVISVGTVSLSSEDVQGTRNDVQEVVDVRRGEITGEETRTSDDGEMTWSRLEVRVPSEAFSQTMTDLEGVATLENASRTAEDVTSQVIDTDVRIRAQERSLRRIEALLDAAGSLRDVVSVEAELTRRQGDLDSLKQQQAYLADQTSMSTITVHVEHSGEPRPREDDDEPDGFLAGLADGWSALAAVGVGLATVAGALLPFAVVLALLGVPLWLVLRRYAARRTARTVGHAG